MIDILKKLLFAREISFEDGNIRMFKERLVLLPAVIFTELENAIKKYNLNVNDVLYEAAKKAGIYHTAMLKKYYKMSPMELLKWNIYSMKLGGWGNAEPGLLDINKKTGTVKITNSPFVELKSGKGNEKCDIIAAGFFAGGGEVIYNVPMICKEVQCEHQGKSFCFFKAEPKKSSQK